MTAAGWSETVIRLHGFYLQAVQRIPEQRFMEKQEYAGAI